MVHRILSHPKYQELKTKRSSFGWWLTLAMMVVYCGFILLVAFNKGFLSTRLGDGVMTIGIPTVILIGFGVIVFTIVITAIYVRRALTLLALFGVSAVVWAAGADLGQSEKKPTNWTAIGMFGAFVLFTLCITKWAAATTQSASDFYTAGSGITGFQNGLAIAGDYMSAASFLGISTAVMASGFDGLIYSIGFLVGWPVITFWSVGSRW